ncbi:MFS transporter [Salipiger aestuarii]|uniref:DHA1 family inner membrane transport protein n=1 Tax=Salipiger aestuarii TaxID=568098 RepID=A0A327YRF5_9RHOB|nr:MFS transporter [Salipiger aestuarii]EIE49156.1 major facilitator transporter [Citreicella sp. 357]KAA8609683.1 MFS transporter [Salipiger aestuarii]KAA8614015.1 MFS transporter [Salipiger aestuarii]KAB2543689.1 MFS transporter [Salipiger aestuarii]RAK22926.1 DHA1 family inner membrane transport protein [Salipiger aestuarii]
MAQLDRQARLTILSFAMGAFAIGITEFAAMGLLPYYARDLGVAEPEAGHAVSAYAIGVVVGAPVLAILGSYLPRKLLLILLMAVFMLTNILTSLATGIDTLVISRVLAGLPHGAFLGIAMLFAAELSPPGRKAAGVAQVLMGLTVANIVGVPAAGAIGQAFGWRWCFVIVAAIAACSMAMMARVAPDVRGGPAPSALRELSALKNRAVWLTLGVGAIGFGAVFAVYSYFSAALISAGGAPEWVIPFALSAFGVGATAGNYYAGRLATWSQFGGTLILLLGMVATTLLYAAVMGHWIAMVAAVAALGLTAGLVIPLQMRLMDVAGEGQTLAAALNHAAFNAGNAIGPWLAGMGLAAGHGWHITGLAGALLAVGGIAMLGLAWIDARPKRRLAVAAE